MGDEIESAEFSVSDFTEFQDTLRKETDVLQNCFREQRFEDRPLVAGYELEAWLIDQDCQPAPVNEEFLNKLRSPMVVPELARFNVEMNAPCESVTGDVLARLESHMRDTWSASCRVAADLDISLAMIGILPTVRQEHLTVENMSDRERFRALNEQILRIRHNMPLCLNIEGRESLQLSQSDVMLESAATSFQMHLQVREREAARYYNAAQIAAGPMVAATSNSPYLFGKDLWAETRIPLFEQSVNVQDDTYRRYQIPRRVTFGEHYIKSSLLELFIENLEQHPVLLPSKLSENPDALEHLRLHNGTIWRWNRPLIGFNEDGVPHLRIEHRVVPAGPSILDLIANIALFIGVVHGLANADVEFQSQLAFGKVKENFYQAAREGLGAGVNWFNAYRGPVDRLLIEEVIPMAERSLLSLGVSEDQVHHYLGIVDRRVRLHRTGSDWQRRFVAEHGSDMRALLSRYLENQELDLAVCDWPT